MLLRGLMNMYMNQHKKRQHADRVLRESSVLRSAAEVWSDVASSLGLGFRSTQAGPLLYGEFPPEATLEITVLETDEGQYRTVAKLTGAKGHPGELLLRPRDATASFLRLFRAPEDLDDAFRKLHLVRTTNDIGASTILTPRVRALLEPLEARRPELYVEPTGATLVLEGVELVHERLTDIIALLTEVALVDRSSVPYRT